MTPEQRKHEEEKHRRRCGYNDLEMTMADVGKLVYLDDFGNFTLASEKGKLFGVITGYSPEKETAIIRDFEPETFLVSRHTYKAKVKNDTTRSNTNP